MRLRGYFTPIVQYARTLRAISPVGTLPIHTVPLSISCTSCFFCGTCLKSDPRSVVTVCLPINVCYANLIPHPQVALPDTELNEVKLTHKCFFEEH